MRQVNGGRSMEIQNRLFFKACLKILALRIILMLLLIVLLNDSKNEDKHKSLSENPGARLCRPRPAAANLEFPADFRTCRVLRLVCDTAALLFQTGSKDDEEQETCPLNFQTAAQIFDALSLTRPAYVLINYISVFAALKYSAAETPVLIR